MTDLSLSIKYPMQSNWKDIYNKASEKYGHSEQTYKDIGNFVYASLYENLRRPKNLIVKLRGIGFWYLRKKRLLIYNNILAPDLNKNPEDFSSDLEQYEYDNKVELYHLFAERLKDYEKYSEIKSKVREERYKTQTIIPPKCE